VGKPFDHDPDSGVQPPNLPWLLLQTWAELLCVHYRVSPEALRAAVPPGLTIDTFRGNAFLSLVALRLDRIETRAHLKVPGKQPFAQLNLRTYVRVGNQRGVYFFSIDASSLLAVAGARSGFLLPYHYADVKHETMAPDSFRFQSRRYTANAYFKASWRPTGPSHGLDTELEQFLLLRDQYLARMVPGGFWRGAVHHPPWQIRDADVDHLTTNLPATLGLTVGDPYCVHHAQTTKSLCWPIVPVL
jgi:hypothetical protein